jgi:PIN domain nuclease of toxin-antitoxin system
MTEYVIDAHALVWMLEGNARLGVAARAVLADPVSILILPATALAEACWVVNKGRTSLADWRDVLAAVRGDRRISVFPLNDAVVERAMSLPPTMEMHDAQILATALIRANGGDDVKMLTRDQSITDSGLVEVVW